MDYLISGALCAAILGLAVLALCHYFPLSRSKRSTNISPVAEAEVELELSSEPEIVVLADLIASRATDEPPPIE